jgi:hypothetical protein
MLSADYAHPTARHSRPFQTDTQELASIQITANRTITMPLAPKTIKRSGMPPLNQNLGGSERHDLRHRFASQERLHLALEYHAG